MRIVVEYVPTLAFGVKLKGLVAAEPYSHTVLTLFCEPFLSSSI